MRMWTGTTTFPPAEWSSTRTCESFHKPELGPKSARAPAQPSEHDRLAVRDLAVLLSKPIEQAPSAPRAAAESSVFEEQLAEARRKARSGLRGPEIADHTGTAAPRHVPRRYGTGRRAKRGVLRRTHITGPTKPASGRALDSRDC